MRCCFVFLSNLIDFKKQTDLKQIETNIQVIFHLFFLLLEIEIRFIFLRFLNKISFDKKEKR
jgi:hypothetical protein